MSTINITFPLQDDREKNGLFSMNRVTSDALKSNLLFLFMTKKGDRYYSPEFGTNLMQFIFEQKDSQTIDDIREELARTVKTYIPELTIRNVQFVTKEDDPSEVQSDYQLNVIIDFTYQEDVFSDTGRLEILF